MADKDYADMSLVELMDALAPLETPPPVSMIPEGPGWAWLLGFIVGGLAILWGWRRYRRYQQRFRYQAIEELRQLSLDDSALAVSAILKRYMLTQYSRQQVASLTGTQWCEFLQSIHPEGPAFDNFYLLKSGPAQSEARDKAIQWLQSYPGAGDAV